MPRPGGGDDQQILDVLHLSDTQWRKLADGLRQNTTSKFEKNNRRHVRTDYVGRVGIALRYSENHWKKFVVFTRDISPTGLGFVHGGYFHVGSECRIVLKTLDKDVLCVNGVVKRCQYLHDRLHDIGVEFTTPIDVGWFVANTA